jgi:uncharacterized protein with GYD domain
MPIYIVLVDFVTAQPRPDPDAEDPGDPPEPLVDALAAIVQAVPEVELHLVCSTLGAHDAVAVIQAEAPEIVARTLRGLVSVAGVRTTTLTAFDMPASQDALKESWTRAWGHLRGGHLRGGHLRGGHLRGGHLRGGTVGDGGGGDDG